MILRKPYAILIKNFRLIHIILAVLMAYLFYKTTNIMGFIGDYIGSSQTTISSSVVGSLFSSIFTLLIAVIIVGNIIIMSLMLFKKKPVKIYIYNIVIYIGSAIIYFVSYNIIKKLEIGLVDIRTLKLVEDLITAVIMAQAPSLAFTIIRATGFDIKNFNFKEDLDDLNIESRDNEEFEVDLDVDTDKVKRRLRKGFRYSKYVYVENKLTINIFIILAVFLVALLVVLNFNVYNRTFKKQDAFKTNEFLFNITNSYLTNQDYYGNIIDKDKEYVIIKLEVNKLYNSYKKLNTGRFTLIIDKQKYYFNSSKKDKFLDLGNTYLNEEITKDKSTYLLIFEVPNNIKYKKMILKYTDTNNRDIKMDVTPTSLKKEKEMGITKLTENLSLEGSSLENSNLVIYSYEFNDTFKVDYKYCLNDNCYDSYEYLKPTITDNTEKTLLKIKGNLTIDDKLHIRNITLPKFLDYFAKVKYTKGDKAYLVKLDFKEIKPKKTKLNDEFYIEIPKYIIDSDRIDLQINVRNSVYIYHLK